ncbi:YqhR family membrane protein [Brevibacillus marinus]|uniref:YqhR family membrane protein n=1 Tax=Brevibacillus marinus TaxID=2496837 RepID=UPI000F8483DA|nr:YqhR family membrane protein [Brevibacillus marinus]
MNATKSGQAGRARSVRLRSRQWRKIAEVSLAGTLIWAFLRMVAAFFHFTPYANYVFSRPLVGMSAEGTRGGAILGLLVLFALSLVAAALYAALFARFRVWWAGILYGGALFLLFGSLFAMWRWNANTICTELAWFVSYGQFVGMTLTAERHDEL